VKVQVTIGVEQEGRSRAGEENIEPQAWRPEKHGARQWSGTTPGATYAVAPEAFLLHLDPCRRVKCYVFVAVRRGIFVLGVIC
jgi:hypothetical protein